MQLPQTARRERNDRCSDGLGHGERRGIHDSQGAATTRHVLKWVVLGIVHE